MVGELPVKCVCIGLEKVTIEVFNSISFVSVSSFGRLFVITMPIVEQSLCYFVYYGKDRWV